jgi:hypothetical protein
VYSSVIHRCHENVFQFAVVTEIFCLFSRCLSMDCSSWSSRKHVSTSRCLAMALFSDFTIPAFSVMSQYIETRDSLLVRDLLHNLLSCTVLTLKILCYGNPKFHSLYLTVVLRFYKQKNISPMNFPYVLNMVLRTL